MGIARRFSIIAIALASVSGCVWPPAPDGQPLVPAPSPAPLPDVALYGDSLTVPAEAEITTGADGIAALTIDAYPGTDLSSWDSDIRALSPSRLVLALGTNDANHGEIAPWRDLLTFLPSSTCVVWPRTFESSDRVTAFVESMDELVADFPNVHVVEWGAQVEAHREWLLPDGIHYRPDGTSAYASMLVEAIQTCLA